MKTLTINEIKNIITPLVTPLPVTRVILFGSYARGDATEKSDVDLIIDSGGAIDYWELLGLIGKIIKTMPIKTDVLGLEEIKKPEFYNNIKNEGIVIYER